MEASYISGLLTGGLTGWILGQFWQSWCDRSMVHLVMDSTQNQGVVSDDSDEHDDLVDQMFNQEMEIRRERQSTPSIPSYLYTKKEGGYLTNNDLNVHGANYQVSKAQKLSRSDELEIMQTFNWIVGMNFTRACEVVKQKGYSLYPIYINDRPKFPTRVFSKSIIGVRVRDPNLSTGGSLSSEATVAEIIDVGGKDYHNRGKTLRQSHD